jgi:hypothetical protein
MTARASVVVFVVGCQADAMPAPAWQPIAYKPGCELAMATAPVAPLAWEPCPSASGVACRQVVLDWTPPASGEWLYPATLASRDGSRVLLHTARFYPERTERLVVELDGNVRVAIAETSPARCVLNAAPSDGPYYAFRVFDDDVTGELDSWGGGALVGAFAQAPRAIEFPRDRVSRSVAVGMPGLVEIAPRGAIWLHPHDGAAVELWSAARDQDRLQSYAAFSGNTLIWSSDDEEVNVAKRWTSGRVDDLVAFGGDVARGAADFGTDGRALVWLAARGRDHAATPFTAFDVMTAPLGDPRAARIIIANARGDAFGVSPFVVGCGHAARADATGLDVIRLRDGATRHLAGSAGWRWDAPLALTCGELVARASVQARAQLARIALVDVGLGELP